MHTLTRYELEELQKRGPVLFPVRGTMSFHAVESGKWTFLLSRRLFVNRFEVNNVPDSKFVANLKPGTAIQDFETQQHYRVSSDGQMVEDNSHQDPGRVQGKRPMGWLFMASLTTLLCLMTGVLWRRQQRRAA